MAGDKATAEKTPKPEQGEAFQDRRRNLLTIAVVGGLMLLEGVGLFFAAKWLSPTAISVAETVADPELLDEEGRPLPEHSEVQVTDLMAFNSKTGQVYVYQLAVYARVETRLAKKIRDLVENRQFTIEDRLGKVVRASDPKYFEEPGLETMRRQFEHELDEILGDDSYVLEVLFPEFSVSRAD